MATDKTSLSGNTTMLILKLLESGEMYGYQIIEELARRSDNTFRLKTGTLYPILHGLENGGMVVSYDKNAGGARVRRYYKLTKKGTGLLLEKHSEWSAYTKAVNLIMEGDASYVTA